MADEEDAGRETIPAPRVTLRDADDELVDMLRSGQMLLLKYPLAARAAIRSLVAEGKRYAQTEEGKRWKDALADTDFIRRGRVVWEGASLNMLEDGTSDVLPSAMLEAVLAAVGSSRTESIVSALFLPEEPNAEPPAG